MEKIVEFLVNAIGYGGYGGIFILMLLESSFFPFPSEIVVPPAAYLAARGEMNIYLVIGSATLGSVAGALLNYYISYKMGYPFLVKYGRYVGINRKRLRKVCMFFERHGAISTFIGRLLPGIRQYISLPAGLAGMNLVAFVGFTALGAAIWVSILAFIGYSVGNHPELVKRLLHKSYIYILASSALIVAIYIYWRKKHDKRI